MRRVLLITWFAKVFIISWRPFHIIIYPLKFYKAKSKLYRISLAPKRNNMFIRIIAAIDSWYCNSLMLLSRLTRVTKKLFKKRRSQSETESATEIVERWVHNGWLLYRVAWTTGLLNSGKQFHALIESTTKISIRLHVLLLENYFTAHFLTPCHGILIDLFSQ